MAMDPTNPEARSMVAQLLAEAAETQGLDSKYVHIGGDEVSDRNKSTRALLQSRESLLT